MKPFSRRRALQLAASGWLALGARHAWPAEDAARQARAARGLVIGHSQGAEVGTRVLADGGNAVDAAVAAALVAGVVAVSQCGIGGYGGHLVVASPDGKVASIDFNSAAPAAARPDMFPLNAAGRVVGGVNSHGWLAAGVPGTLAGLQLALDRFGSRSLDQLIEPAIRFARDGFPISGAFAKSIASAAGQFRRDAGSARLFLPDGRPPEEGQTFRNPDLAAMLERLARDNSVAAFYRGDIAGRIAASFAKNGGLVTADDLAKYNAREVPPLELAWRGSTIYTAPLTAGGLKRFASPRHAQRRSTGRTGTPPIPARCRLASKRCGSPGTTASRCSAIRRPAKCRCRD